MSANAQSYHSIREQLNQGKLKQENAELRQQNSFFKSLIEQHGLSHFLSERKDLRKDQNIHR